MGDYRNILQDTDIERSDLGISGLVFRPNGVVTDSAPGWTKIHSNTGYTIGHFVTHDALFTYGNQIGLHLGQIDQLTFVSETATTITGTFIDCRLGSETFGSRVELKFNTNINRKLIIPCGVAHSFANIGNVVTRNDLLLYSPSVEAIWKIEEDLVAMPLDIARDQVTPVEPYSLPLPRETAIMFYKLQTMLMRGGRSREFGTHNISDPQNLKPKRHDSNALRCQQNSFFPVANRSWGILPSTQSCEMELLFVEASPESSPNTIQTDGTVFHTVLNNSNGLIEIDVIDTHNRTETYEFLCDERVRLELPGGRTYRYRASRPLIIRQEFESD